MTRLGFSASGDGSARASATLSPRTLRRGTWLAFGLTWMFRWATAAFTNDHFTHLSRARQILAGDLPIRDFFDPGQFLHYYLSAAGQLVFGYNLLGEALLTITFIAGAAALAFRLSALLSGSISVAVCSTALAVAALPRLYNYPKVFLYTAALWLAWRYSHTPGRRGVAVLSAFSVLALLFRYVHGAYIGVYFVALLTFVHAGRWREWLVAVGTYGGLCIALTLPFLAYVQWATGLAGYVESARSSATMAVTAPLVLRRLSFDIDLSEPLLVVAPDSSVVHALPGRAFWERLDRTIPLFRTRVAPGVLTSNNALVWFYDVTMAVPLAAMVLCALAWSRRTIRRSEATAIAATACLALLISRTLLADSPEARLGDIAHPTAVLGAWAAGRWLAAPLHRAAGPTFRVVVIAVLFVVTTWSVAVQSNLVMTVGYSLRSLGWDPIWAATERLRTRPIDAWAPLGSTGVRALSRYVSRCTSPSDRLLIAGGFAPEVFYYAERAFAGGQVHFMDGWHDSPADQALTVERLRYESVPIAMMMGPQEAHFEGNFPAVASYIRDHYVEVARSGFGDSVEWRVLAERGRVAIGRDPELGLPCYVDRSGPPPLPPS